MPQCLALLVSALLLPSLAQARDYDTYRADYFKGAFCSAIGGACAADNDMISGLFQNPAALATGEATWDFDGDYASRGIVEPGTVSGNNGAVDSSAVGGLAYSTGKWGMGLSFIWRHSNVDSATTIYEDSGKKLGTRLYGDVYTTQFRLPIAYHFNGGGSVGVTFVVNHQFEELNISNPVNVLQTQPSTTQLRILVGGLLPLSPDLRLGTWFRLPSNIADYIAFSSPTTGFVSYKEDFSQHSPWIWALGGAYQASPTWNLYAENDLIGPTRQGYLFSYSVFTVDSTNTALTEKGHSIVFEPHLGARHKFNEKLRMHMGAYFENSRWEKVAGRVHGTGGISYQVGNLVEVIAGADIARRFKQIFFTFR
jgi:hypothetical protein